MNTTTPAIDATFEIVPASAGIEPATKERLEVAFTSFFTQAREWKEKCEAITDPKLARVARLELKNIRIAAEKKHKELKEQSLREGRAVDGAKNIFLAYIVPIEQAMDDIEKQEERRLAAEAAALLEERTDAIRPYADPSMPLPNLGTMSADQFARYLADAKTLHQAKLEAAARVEAERIEREKKEAAEREAQRLENIRLKEEAEAREKSMQAEREAAEKALAEERRIAAEKEAAAAKERAAIEAKARQEREEAEAKAKAAEAEAKRLREAEEKRIADEKAAAEAKAKAEKLAAKKAAAAPDKAKLMRFVEDLSIIRTPEMKSQEGKELAADIDSRILSLAKWIQEKATTL